MVPNPIRQFLAAVIWKPFEVLIQLDEERVESLKDLLKGVFVLAIVFSLFKACAMLQQGIYPDLTDRGMFGDSFGFTNALFSGLAFAGVIYAILLQRKELQLQRQELKETREEIHRSANAHEDTLALAENDHLFRQLQAQRAATLVLEETASNDEYQTEPALIRRSFHTMTNFGQVVFDLAMDPQSIAPAIEDLKVHCEQFAVLRNGGEIELDITYPVPLEGEDINFTLRINYTDATGTSRWQIYKWVYPDRKLTCLNAGLP